jgi:hypothetical protein
MRKLRHDSTCPCKSGKKYGQCCALKGIEYVTMDNGIHQKVNFKPWLGEDLEKSLDIYEEVFGRKYQEEDPLLPKLLLYSDDEFIDMSAEIFKQEFGTTEEEIYAYKKLGYIITKENRKFAPEKDIKEWNKVKKEFRDLKSGKKEKEDESLIYYFEELEDWVVRLIYLYALLLRKAEEDFKDSLDLTRSLNLKSYVLFCITKNLKSLKASRALTAHNFTEDAFSLLRSMYENYLQITTAVFNPNQILNELKAKIGLSEGTHYLEKNIIIEKATNKRTVLLNNKQRASLDKELNNENMFIYNNLYQFFSYFVHPDIRIASFYFKDGFLSHNNNESKNVIFWYINYINAIFLFELLKLNLFDGLNKRDIVFILKNICKLLLMTENSNKSIIHSRLRKMLKSEILK